MSLGRILTLNNGVKFPQIGFGTWQAKPGEVERAVAEAIKVGYRHIDAALIYGNQNEVADGIEEAKVPREELTIVSKLWNNSHRPENVEPDLDTTLSQLRTPYLDVYLIHWPVAFKAGEKLSPVGADGNTELDQEVSIVDTWKEVVRIYKETKKVKAIGVSNFTIEHLEAVIKATGVVPAVNQIEAHPSLIQPELFKYCKEKGIVITAYSPLGNNLTGKPRVIDAPEVKKIADGLGKEPAQVLIAWATKNGFAVIPKSVTPARIKTNFDDFELSDSDFEAINKWGLSNQVRANVPVLYKPKWDIDIFGTEEEKAATHKVVI